MTLTVCQPRPVGRETLTVVTGGAGLIDTTGSIATTSLRLWWSAVAVASSGKQGTPVQIRDGPAAVIGRCMIVATLRVRQFVHQGRLYQSAIAAAT